MDQGAIGALVVICLLGAFIAGSIAYSRSGATSSFVVFFIFGALLPLIGIIFACFVRRPTPAPQPPGWYTDPWQAASYRWYDGYQWTYHISNGVPATGEPERTL